MYGSRLPVGSSARIISGLFKEALYTYSYDESVSVNSIGVDSGIFKLGLLNYTMETESINITALDIPFGIFRRGLISYDYYIPESISISSIQVTASP